MTQQRILKKINHFLTSSGVVNWASEEYKINRSSLEEEEDGEDEEESTTCRPQSKSIQGGDHGEILVRIQRHWL